MTRLRPLTLIVVATLLPAAARADHTEREQHTAECVAALDASTEDLARQIKAGRDDLRPQLLGRLKSGAAFIGTAYLQGERDEARSQALLNEARQAQKSLPEPALAARQTACADEGTRLLDDANIIEREVASRLAQRRMNLLLSR